MFRYQRTIAAVCAAVIAAGGAAPVALALQSEENGRIENIYVYTMTLDEVEAIDLEMVLERSLNNDDNLALLTLKTAALQSKQEDLTAQADELGGASFTGGRLPETPEELAGAMAQQGAAVDPAEELWMGPMTAMTNKAVNQTIQGVGALASGMNELVAQQRYQMRSTAHQLGTDRFNTYHQLAEAKEGIRLQQIAQYVQLLAMKKQLAVMDEAERTVRDALDRATRLRELGLASGEDVIAAERALAQQGDQAKQLEESFRLALIQLSFDIGIAYNPDLVIRDIEGIEPAPVERVDSPTLLERAYQVKMASNTLDESMWQQEHAVTSSVYGDQYASTNTSIAAIQNGQTQLELTKKIEVTYSEAKDAYEAYLTESRKLTELQADLRKMEIRYQAGVISKYDVNAFGMKLKQAQAARDISEWKWYVMREKAEAMERGFIM